jgi:pimeloyl-ACP methyl ester carboxylesterase
MICLPGAYQSAAEFDGAGFARRVADRHLSVDLVFVDLELQHLGDRAAVERLRAEWILPALEAKTPVWLCGISLGGLIALLYAEAHRDELTGLCLLAPYLGNRMLTGEIARAPSVAQWQPGALAESDDERRVWRYIQSCGQDAPPLYLGFGQDDRFAAAHRLMASALPAARVDIVAGGHDWATWSKLWELFLDAWFR